MPKDFFTSQNSKLFCNMGLHFVLTNRYHGISNAPFDSLNLAYHVNDTLESVKKNRAYIMQKYYKNKTLLYLNQIHSNTIFTIRENRGILDLIHCFSLHFYIAFKPSWLVSTKKRKCAMSLIDKPYFHSVNLLNHSLAHSHFVFAIPVLFCLCF